jgi:hypothetical protein
MLVLNRKDQHLLLSLTASVSNIKEDRLKQCLMLMGGINVEIPPILSNLADKYNDITKAIKRNLLDNSGGSIILPQSQEVIIDKIVELKLREENALEKMVESKSLNIEEAKRLFDIYSKCNKDRIIYIKNLDSNLSDLLKLLYGKKTEEDLEDEEDPVENTKGLISAVKRVQSNLPQEPLSIEEAEKLIEKGLKGEEFAYQVMIGDGEVKGNNYQPPNHKGKVNIVRFNPEGFLSDYRQNNSGDDPRIKIYPLEIEKKEPLLYFYLVLDRLIEGLEGELANYTTHKSTANIDFDRFFDLNSASATPPELKVFHDALENQIRVKAEAAKLTDIKFDAEKLLNAERFANLEKRASIKQGLESHSVYMKRKIEDLFVNLRSINQSDLKIKNLEDSQTFGLTESEKETYNRLSSLNSMLIKEIDTVNNSIRNLRDGNLSNIKNQVEEQIKKVEDLLNDKNADTNLRNELKSKLISLKTTSLSLDKATNQQVKFFLDDQTKQRDLLEKQKRTVDFHLNILKAQVEDNRKKANTNNFLDKGFIKPFSVSNDP